MEKISSKEIEEVKKTIGDLFKKYGSYFSSKDIALWFRSCPTDAVKSGANKILQTRGEGKGRLELWLETYMTNYYIENKELPSYNKIVQQINNHFDIPYEVKKNKKGKEIKKVPERIRKIIMRVKKRIYARIGSGKLKSRDTAYKKISESLDSYLMGKIDIFELVDIWKKNKRFLSKKDKDYFFNEFDYYKISKLYFGEKEH